MEKLELLCPVSGNTKGTAFMEHNRQVPQKPKIRATLGHIATPFLDLYPKVLNQDLQRLWGLPCSLQHVHSSQDVGKSKFLLTQEWISKM